MLRTRPIRLARFALACAGLATACAVSAISWDRGSGQPAEPGPITIILVRHADRDGERDALTPEGDVRARELAHVTRHAGISAIYCTKTTRTRATASPAASALGLSPIELDPADVEGLVRRILDGHAGETVLVVGHSNTIPKIVAALGGPTIPYVAERDFDDLFVLTTEPGPRRRARLVHLQYGAATPPRRPAPTESR
jgi:broad specificity phosphatase PhoE